MQTNVTKERNPKLAFSVKELVEMVGVCERKIYYEITSGRLKTVKIGRRVLIRADEIRRWLADAEV